MTFTYSISDKEFKEYIQNFYKKNLFKRYWIYLLIIAVIILFNLYNNVTRGTPSISDVDVQEPEHSFLAPLLTWIVLIAIMVGLWYFIFKKLSGSFGIKKQDREIILDERTLTVDTDKIQAKTMTSETTYQWNAIKKWEQTTNLYLLYVASNAAVILPKRVFANEIEKQEFETLLKTKIQSLSDGKYLDA